MKCTFSRGTLRLFVALGIVGVSWGAVLGQGGKTTKGLTKQQQQALKGLSKEEVEVLAKVKRNQQIPVFKSGTSGKERAVAVEELDKAIAQAKRGRLSRELTMGVRQWEKLSQSQKQQLLTGRGGSVATTPGYVVAVAVVAFAYNVAKDYNYINNRDRLIGMRRTTKQELDVINAAQIQVGLTGRTPIPGPRPEPGPRPIGGIDPPKPSGGVTPPEPIGGVTPPGPDPRPGPRPLPESKLDF